MIKKLVYFLLILIPIASFSDDQVVVNINARVLEKTCIISNTAISVSLKTNILKSRPINTPFGSVPFYIDIKECPKYSSYAHITFKANPDNINPQLIKNAVGEGYAEGVGLALLDNNDNIININSNRMDYLIDHNLLINKIEFKVAYSKTTDSYRVGRVLGVAEFEVSYD